MKIVLVLGFLLLVLTKIDSQGIFQAVIKSEKEKQVLAGTVVSIKDSKKEIIADSNGYVLINDIPAGKHLFVFKHIGYKSIEKEYLFPFTMDKPVIILLTMEMNELDEVVVQTTRTGYRLRENPTRIEVIAPDELDEKSTMKPGDIRMLLNESTGITTQTTSAVSGLASLRIQGLDGRYTQLLKDGMPLYTGFSGGLGILQIAPLDLKQVEYIKGSASTLYGGGAIAGLVNLITKTPVDKPELSFLLNANTGKGLDADGFYSKKWKTFGTTIFSSYNYNGPFDPAGNGLTAIPKTNRFTFNPKFFWGLTQKTTAWFGLNSTFENRYGGDMAVVNGMPDNTHQYFEKNNTQRLSTQLTVSHTIDAFSKLSFKNTIGFLNRSLQLPGTLFKGNQWSTFSELSYAYHKNKSDWVTGINEWTEKFNPQDSTKLNYQQATVGIFLQNTYKVNTWFSLESGLRLDYSTPATKDHTNKLYFLPRVNVLFKISPQITSRIGGGFGYKMPTPFIDEAEKKGYRNILSPDFSSLTTERSYGVNADINYTIRDDEFTLNLNQLFFYTRLDNPVLLQGNAFVNASGYLTTKGAETNLKISIDELALYLGYSYADVNRKYSGQQTVQPLTPKHRLNADLTYEIENSFRFGLEAFYTGQQLLNDGTTGNAYTTFGVLVQKMWKQLSVFLNAENLFGVRQTKWGSIYSGTITNPLFTDIYAPLDGAVINAGIKLIIK
jgi:outer membrane receptor for ferrienterochelin and colicins